MAQSRIESRWHWPSTFSSASKVDGEMQVSETANKNTVRIMI